MRLKVKPTVCKHCPAERYKFDGGESNMCKKHINIYRRAWYKNTKISTGSSEQTGNAAKASASCTQEENSKTSGSVDAVPGQPPILNVDKTPDLVNRCDVPAETKNSGESAV